MGTPEPERQLEQIVRRIDPQARLLRVWPLKGGISARMTAFEAALADGRTKKMILRQPGRATLERNPQAVENEFNLLQITQSAGLPSPAAYLQDQSGTILPTPYLVIEYVDGEMEFTPADLDSYLRQFSEQLAKIHSLEGPRPDLAFLPRVADLCTQKLNVRPPDLDPASDKGSIRATLESAWPWLQINQSVLLHGDYWPGNTLWKEGKLVGVIDWEDAALGDPLADLASSRLDVLLIFGMEAMQVFTRYYLSITGCDATYLPYWDLYSALRPPSDLSQWTAVYPAYGRPDITAESMQAGVRVFVKEAFEKLFGLQRDNDSILGFEAPP